MIAELFIAFAVSQSTPHIATAPSPAPATRVLQVGTLERIPYSWKETDGTWTGPAIKLWQEIAAKNGFQYELKEFTWDEMNLKMQDGSMDICATGVQITAEEDRTINFAFPFYAGGFSIAAHSREATLPRTVIARVMTFEVLIWLIFMILATGVAGSIIRIVERRGGSGQFAQPSSFVNSMWWAVSTLSTVGYGDFVPRTTTGKLVGTIWIFVSIILVAIFSATIVATLTVGRLSPYLKSLENIQTNRVGIIDRPSSRLISKKLGILPDIYANYNDAFEALDRREINGFLHPTIELKSMMIQRRDPNIYLIPTEITKGFISIGISEKLDGKIVSKINSSIIEIIESPEWIETLQTMI